ncbi:hypothetical protein PV327_006022 [Microctonus hyperodae]|uniref:HP domain-containing protein n=1 Tax=Microctonus hyperodae TaxID=165561 RepID=A0AA39G2Y1_MICHY|nr:hypothetical protein PV327_006022 [Microctonus hyperodae]
MYESCSRVLRQDDKSSSDDSGSDAFRNVPRNRTAFIIWKIEGLQAISVPRNIIGHFLSESAYIIYAISSKDGGLPYPEMPLKEIKGNNAVKTIHFWIGSSCDSTMSGAAALRAAELDAQVGATILFRESEGRESSRFLAYFRQHLRIERMHLENPQMILQRVTGLAIPITIEMETISWEHFSSGDVMILDIQSQGVIFLWLGTNANPLHKRHAVRILEPRKENNNVRIIIVDDGYEQTLKGEDKKLFDRILDPKARVVLPQSQRHSHTPSAIKLYKCCEQSGKYKVAELKSGPIFRSDLTSNSVFIIDRGEAGVWAWVGREVDAREKLEAVRNARGFVKKKGYSSCLRVARAIEDAEPLEMKSLLRSWEPARSRPLILQTSFDSEYMNERPRMAAECQLIDDGSGKKTVWRVSKRDNMREVKETKDELNGIFYAGVCYIIRYIYGSGRREKSIVYCWNGAHSTSVDREAALEAACRLAEDTAAQLVKASQGCEPSHLLQIYGGKLRILAGPHQDSPPHKYLVRVFGSTPYTSKAVERPLRASSLDSGGVFILFSTSPIVWCGGKSTGDAREASRRLAPVAAPLVAEGKENEEFWSQLGGRGSYCSETEEILEESGKHLYQCIVMENAFVGEEVLGFSQNSLIPEANWLLDVGSVIWVWMGALSDTKSMKKCGQEPPTFIGLFDNWNHNNLREYRTFEDFRISIEGNRPCTNNRYENPASEFDGYVKYPLRILKNEAEHLPTDVDVFKKEMHLTYDDFTSIFKMNPVEFEKLPAWRRQRLKQAAGLF